MPDVTSMSLFLAISVDFASAWAPANPQLLTRWAADVNPTSAHPEHPRPDAFRGPDSWTTLNGLWDADSSPDNLTHPPFSPAVMPQRILVPYPFEAALSGIRELPRHHYMWYRRNITIAAAKLENGGRVLLKFEAVDWQSEVYINGHRIGRHSGGYDGFEFDITDVLAGMTTAEVVVGVYDPTEAGNQPHGKQYMAAFAASKASSKYTSTSGIWATVWLEYVSATYLADLHIATVAVGATSATINVNATISGTKDTDCSVNVTVLDGGTAVGTASSTNAVNSAQANVVLTISPLPKLWTPETPFLYNLTVSLICEGSKTRDVLNSYIGIRTVKLQPVKSPVSTGCAYQGGYEMPGYPKRMSSATACAAACVQPTCAAWSFGAVMPPPSPPTPPPKKCTDEPQPCPHHKARTYCESDPSKDQCDKPSVSKCPPCPQNSGPGIDLHGGDLPGMPIRLNGSDASSLANSEKACFTLCDERKNYGAPAERCIAWVINVPGCKSPGHSSWKYSECWLKAGGGSIPKTVNNKCRVSGIVSKINDGGTSDGANTVFGEKSPSMCTLHSLLPKSPIVRSNTSSCGYWATKLMLNNQPAPFASGILSQGFWPDGEYTVPTDAADIYELTSHKRMGFNFIRKHIKVAPHRWYYHTDRLGILVWQDMPETIHATGSGPTFMSELAAMVKGRRNHPSIIQWDIFNECSPAKETLEKSVQLIKSLDMTRPIDACSGCHTQEDWWSLSNVQDFHTDTFEDEPLNSSLLTAFAEAHRCGCLPPKEHMWFHKLPVADACYSVTKGVDCDSASQTYLPWAKAELDQVKFFGLSATGYVQNRDMEGECNGLLTYDASPKLNSTPIVAGNRLLAEVHAATWER